MLIQAIDNKLYKNPVIEGDGFFARFLESEDPEVFIKCGSRTTLNSSKKLIKASFMKISIKYKLIGEGYMDLYTFPPNWNKPVRGVSWSFILHGKIPIPNAFDAVISSPPFDVAYQAWTLSFPTEEIINFFGGEHHPLLASFIIGSQIYKDQVDDVIRTITRRLNKQFPGISKIRNVAEAIKRFGPMLTLERK